MNNLRSPNMQSIGKRSNITLGAALSTDPAIGHEKRPHSRTRGTAPTVGCKRRPYCRWQRAVPKRKCTPLGRLACRLPWAFHSPPFGGRGWGWVSGAGLWAGGGSLGWGVVLWGWVSNAKRVPTAQGLGNPRLLKGGGYLLSRIALQYHRRRRA